MDLQEAFDAGFEAVKTYVERSFDAYAARLDEIEKRISNLPAPRDGKDADLDEVRKMIAEEMRGASTTELPDIPALISEAVNALPAPQDGKSVTVEDVAPLIAAEVEKRLSELPVAKDGKDGADGKDGIGLAGALIDRSGELVVTLTNGEAKNLGPIVGKDGDPGKPGKDGFSLKHFDADLLADGRTILLKFEDGSDQSYSVEIGVPTMIYRGVFKEGQQYEKGDTVTWGGSLWHCDEDTTDKPDTASKAWTLAAKRGRDGKDGVVKEAPKPPIVRVGVPAKKDDK